MGWFYLGLLVAITMIAVVVAEIEKEKLRK